MGRSKREILDWIADQVEAAKDKGATVESRAIYHALRTEFPDDQISFEEVCAALVRVTADAGLAVEFNERRPAS